MESKKNFYRKAVKVERGKVLKENSIAGRTWSSGKLFVLKNNTTIANRNMPLIVENLIFFSFR